MSDEVEQFVRNQENRNTLKKTDTDLKLVTQFLTANGETRELTSIPPAELDPMLADFIIRVRKRDGGEFEPVTLRSIISSIDRKLRRQKYGTCIMGTKDHCFEETRNALKVKKNSLKKQGKGNYPNRAAAISDGEVNILYDKKQLGSSSSTALLNTMWFNNCVHFGLRGVNEHYNLMWGDITLKQSSDGTEYIELNERATKTRTGDDLTNVRQVTPKIYADGNGDRYPIYLYKLYADKRPKKGRLDVNIKIPSWVEIEAASPGLSPGGRYSPPDCTARSRVAIIIPYRDREMHLKIFLRNIHPFLQRQQLDYGIYVVELVDGVKFNRALLMNIGFVESAKVYPYQCFIFHDVDLIPENDRNLYSCPDKPRHMSVAIDTLKYKLPYAQLFGGVSAINKEQFLKINGFSNVFFGWGGEDDDLYKRIIDTNLTVTRYSPEVGRYMMLRHKKEQKNPERLAILKTTNMRQPIDGLNSLKYKVINMANKPLFTWILVTFNETRILKDEQLAAKLPAKVVNPREKALGKVFQPHRPAILTLVPTNGTVPYNLTGDDALAYN